MITEEDREAAKVLWESLDTGCGCCVSSTTAEILEQIAEFLSNVRATK